MMSQEQQPTTETAVAPTPAPNPDMVELQRREKALRIRENKLKQELENQRNSLISEFKSNPMAKLQELGLSADKVAEYFLNGEPKNEVDPTKKEIEDLKRQLQEQKAEQDKRMVAEFKQGVMSHVEKAADKYELINNHRDGKNLYWNSVVAYYEEYGEVPNYDEIADKVESELYEHGKKLLGLSKFKAAEKAEAIASEVREEENDKAPAKKKQPRATISSSLTASSTPSNRATIEPSKSTISPAYTTKLAALQAAKRAAWGK